MKIFGFFDDKKDYFNNYGISSPRLRIIQLRAAPPCCFLHITNFSMNSEV